MSGLAYSIDIPANTTKANPAVSRINLMAGIVTEISVGFRDGCAYLVSLAIFDELKQVLPAIEGQELKGNDYVFSFPYKIVVPTVGKQLTLKGWSPDTIYPHTVYVWFTLLTKDEQTEALSIEQLLHYTPPITTTVT